MTLASTAVPLTITDCLAAPPPDTKTVSLYVLTVEGANRTYTVSNPNVDPEYGKATYDE